MVGTEHQARIEVRHKRPLRESVKIWYSRLIIPVIIIVIAGGTGGFFIYKNIAKKHAAQERERVMNTSRQYIADHKYHTAEKLLQDYLLEKGVTPDARYEALVTLGAVQYVNKEDDTALQSLLEAEKIKGNETSSDSLVRIASIYQKKNNKPQAIVYLKKAIVRSTATPDQGDDAVVPQYQAAIKRLGGTP
jgi:TolA-binding protein